jgi:hypothetical protein
LLLEEALDLDEVLLDAARLEVFLFLLLVAFVFLEVLGFDAALL